MDYFPYQNGEMLAESLPVREIAERFGTPCYVYSRAALENHFRQLTGRTSFNGQLTWYFLIRQGR